MISQVLEMASVDHRVTLLAVTNDPRPEIPAHVEAAIRVRRPDLVSAAMSFLSEPSAPLQSHLFASGSVARQVVEEVRRLKPDVVMLDMIRFAVLAPLVRTASPGSRIVVDMDDLLSARYRQMKANGERNLFGAFGERMPRLLRSLSALAPVAILGLEERLVARAEAEAARDADGIAFVSPAEARNFEHEHGRAGLVIEAVRPVAEAAEARGRDFSNGIRFVFLGNAGYAPNAEALEELDAIAGESLGRLSATASRPRRFSFEAAGPGTDKAPFRLVAGKGFADSLDDFLGPDAVMVAPIRTGTGIKTKLLDAMARGVPILTTSKGAEGLDIEHGASFVLCETRAEFADAIVTAVSGANDDTMERIGLGGAKIAREQHAAEAISCALARVLDGGPSRHNSPIVVPPRPFAGLRKAVHAGAIACGDIVAAFIAAIVAFHLAQIVSPAITGVHYVYFSRAFGDRAPVALPIMLAAAIWLYGRGHYAERVPFWTEVRDILGASAMAFMAEGFIQYAVKEHVSRFWIAGDYLILIPLIVLIRSWMKWALMEIEVRRVDVCLFGDRDGSAKEAVEAERLLGFKVVRSLSDATPDAALEAMRECGAEMAIVASGGDFDTSAAGVVQILSKHEVPFALCPPLGGLGLASMRPLVLFGHDAVLLMERRGLSNPLARASKRIVDIVAAAVGLCVVTPVLLVAGLAVKRDGGPVFYRQARVGRKGRKIFVWKLRSMVVDADRRLAQLLEGDAEARAEWDLTRKLKNDPRVTPVGKFLRKSAIDELPQLWNVLKGDMSLVGPRPVLDAEMEHYGDDAHVYMGVRPGVTGLWQVSGRNDLSYGRRIELDSWYVRNWSLWIDLVVVLKTVPALLTSRGAY